MKVRLNRWYNFLLTALLGVLGFSCGGDDDDDDVRVEYGVPNVEFQVKGTVTDEAGTPIQGIKVSVRSVYDNHVVGEDAISEGLDSVLTDSEGKFQTEMIRWYDTSRAHLFVDDIDGEANGGDFASLTYKLDSQYAPITKKQLEEGRSWYAGKYEYAVEAQMKKKAE